MGALDLKAPATAQMALYQEIANVLRGQTFWLTRHAMTDKGQVQALIDAYRPADRRPDGRRPEPALACSNSKMPFRRSGRSRFIDLGAPKDAGRDRWPRSAP